MFKVIEFANNPINNVSARGGGYNTTYSVIKDGVKTPVSYAAYANAKRDIASAARPTSSSSSFGGNAAEVLKQQQQQKYQEALAANKAMEAKIGTMYKDRYASVMGNLEGMGQQTRKNILESGQREKGIAEQDSIARGFNMGTVRNSLMNSVQEGTDRNLGMLAESLRAQKLGYDSSLRKDEADFYERISNEYPSQGIFSSALSSYGAGEGAMGVGASSMLGGGTTQGLRHAFYQGQDALTGQARSSVLPMGRYASSLKQFSTANALEAAKKKQKRATTPSSYSDVFYSGAAPSLNLSGGTLGDLPQLNAITLQDWEENPFA